MPVTRVVLLLIACSILRPNGTTAQEVGTCEFFTPNEGFSNAFCAAERGEFYSFSEMSTSLRDPATGIAADAVSTMAAAGVDVDAQCMISVGSKKLNENDRPSGPGETTLTIAGTQTRAVGNYGGTASPDGGIFGLPVQCDILEKILATKSVTLTWSTKSSEQTFTVNEETFDGFRDALEKVLERSRSRRSE